MEWMEGLGLVSDKPRFQSWLRHTSQQCNLGTLNLSELLFLPLKVK